MRIYKYQPHNSSIGSALSSLQGIFSNPEKYPIEEINDLEQFLKEEKKKAKFIKDENEATIYVYVFSNEGLRLNRYIGGKLEGSVFIDFTSYQFQQKIKSISHRSQPILKALGSRSHGDLVIDATCGLGQDSFLMVAQKLKVIGIERNPYVFPLLEDAYLRALKDERVGPHFKERFKIIHKSAIEVLKEITNEKPKVIYLDPMFPQKEKTALSKGEMEIFKDLVGTDSDFQELFDMAMKCTQERVIVKRPTYIPSLNENKAIFEGKLVNYEVYRVV